jgi:hypothetical protein
MPRKFRPLYLLFYNAAFVAAPLTVALVVRDNSFNIIYIISAVLVSILWFVIAAVFRGTDPQIYREVGFSNSLRKFVQARVFRQYFYPQFCASVFLCES